jgi:hypothetical protein
MRKTLPWLLAASALLLAGAGCTGTGTTYQGSVGANVPSAAPASQKTNADLAVDAFLQGASTDEAAAANEDADKAQMTGTDDQLNAYGTAYDSTSF